MHTEQSPIACWLAQLVPQKLTFVYQPGWTPMWVGLSTNMDNNVLGPHGMAECIGDAHTAEPYHH